MKKLLLLLALSTWLFSSTELSITSEDGFKLYGWLDKPDTAKNPVPLILFAHQFGAEHSTWDSLSKEFNKRGFATLNVDLRGHGKSAIQNGKENRVVSSFSKSSEKVGFENIPDDLTAWLELVSEDESIDMDSLYLFGSSLGAASIIPLLNEYEAKALVAISAGGLEALKETTDMALSMSMTKELFIAAKGDQLGAAERSIEYVKKSILGTSLIIPGDGHGTVLLPKIEPYIFTFIESIE